MPERDPSNINIFGRTFECCQCGRLVTVTASPATSRPLVCDPPPPDLHMHVCATGHPVAVADITGSTARIVPVRGEAEILAILRGRTVGPADRVASATATLAGQGVVLLAAVQP